VRHTVVLIDESTDSSTHSNTWYVFGGTRGTYSENTWYVFGGTRGTYSENTWYVFREHVVRIQRTRGTYSEDYYGDRTQDASAESAGQCGVRGGGARLREMED
jgi:hypothetical protein